VWGRENRGRREVGEIRSQTGKEGRKGMGEGKGVSLVE